MSRSFGVAHGMMGVLLFSAAGGLLFGVSQVVGPVLGGGALVGAGDSGVLVRVRFLTACRMVNARGGNMVGAYPPSDAVAVFFSFGGISNPTKRREPTVH